MKKNLLLFAMILISSLIQAQVNPEIFGMTNTASGKFFSKIDPLTGSITFISNLISDSSNFYGRTINLKNQVYYSLQDSVVLKFDLSNGQYLETLHIINNPNMYFRGIAYNCHDSTYYGLSVSTVDPHIHVSKINMNTGVVQNISDSIAPSYRQYTATAIDPFNDLFYFETTTNLLITVDLLSGEVLSSVQINLPTNQFFGPLSYNCMNSTLYGLVGNATSGRKLAKIDPLTGDVTIISGSIVAYSIFVNPSTINPAKSLYYFIESDGTLRGVGLNDGELETNVPIVFPTPDPEIHFLNFIYFNECPCDYPLLTDNHIRERILINPNPINDEIIGSL
ncbi:MAG: hypothetical protein EOM90_01745 [Alphaproteobacteria bacterium]|nr:hypothetical protein [Alphaproteobacteria bacterium]